MGCQHDLGRERLVQDLHDDFRIAAIALRDGATLDVLARAAAQRVNAALLGCVVGQGAAAEGDLELRLKAARSGLSREEKGSSSSRAWGSASRARSRLTRAF